MVFDTIFAFRRMLLYQGF